MGEPLRIETPGKIRKRLLSLGFKLVRSRGSHEQYVCENGCHTVTLAVHAGKDVPTSDIRSIIRQSGCSKEEFYNAQKKCVRDSRHD